MNEALLYHMSAEDRLKAQQTKLESENQDLASEKEMNDMVIQQKVSQTRSQKAQIKQVCNHGNAITERANQTGL